MKKFTLLFFACMMAFVSCKDENGGPDATGPDIEPPPAAEANTLPRQIVLRSGGEVERYTIAYKSGSKKIDKITKLNGAIETYHYNGQDLIERIDYGNGGSDGNRAFFYNNGVLIRVESTRAGQIIEKVEYTYPSDNKITIANSHKEDGNWEVDDPIILEFDSKGNVIKGMQDALQATVSYNDKNSPFLNAEGWSKINFTGGIPLGDHVDISDIVGRRNNPTHTKVTEEGTSLLDLTFGYEFSDMDNAKFPTKITGKQGGETVFTVEICYSGNCNLSTDPDNPDEPNLETATLPETIVMTSGGDTKTYTIVYQENSKKIDKITETGGASTTYIYDGERIQKVSLGSANSEDYNLYSYDGSGRLTKDENFRSSGETGTTTFSYSGGKTIVTGDGVGDLQVELSYDGNENLTNAVLKDGTMSVGTVSITYNDKNAPFKNVPGWRDIRYLIGAPLGDNIGFEDILGSGNNPTGLTGTFDGDNVNVSYVYEFNDSKNPKFPTKVTGTKKVGTEPAETFVAEITYKP
ncbi:hypothetical protein G5B30_09835 [Sphingobacterium sp. SGG-5]|uniref:hypothetical protein n=1 Tax=Sphingobacterium sp. SGG-5 TaxID=2710881 RepID=UPI0013EE1CF6|nr:hypothetical protein [Sphingobacterium sp. SGG-5]NGM62214.1 hypothetical protein [Sphingobacterium sp. SGG-5]